MARKKRKPRKSRLDEFGRSSVCLGPKGHPARNVRDQFVRVHGSQAFSGLVRQLLSRYQKDPEFQKHLLIKELECLVKEFELLSMKRKRVLSQLKDLGADVEQIIVDVASKVRL